MHLLQKNRQLEHAGVDTLSSCIEYEAPNQSIYTHPRPSHDPFVCQALFQDSDLSCTGTRALLQIQLSGAPPQPLNAIQTHRRRIMRIPGQELGILLKPAPAGELLPQTLTLPLTLPPTVPCP